MSTEKSDERKSCIVAAYLPNVWPIVEGADSGFGGAESEMWTVVRCLARRGQLEIHMVCNASSSLALHREGVPVATVVPPALTADHSRARRLVLLGRYFGALAAALKRTKANCYYTKLASVETIVVSIVGRWSSVPVVYRVEHDWEVAPETLQKYCMGGSRWKRWLLIWALRSAAQVICQTEFQRRALQDNYQVEALLIANAHEMPDKISMFEDRDQVLWIGRCHPMKRPGLFLELAAMNASIQHVMVAPITQGHDELFACTRDQAMNTQNVTFVPGVPLGAIPSLFRRARVLVLTSEAEGYSNVMIEALKHGVPVVSLAVNPDSVLEPVCSEIQARSMPALGFCVDDNLPLASRIVANYWWNREFWLESSRLARTHAGRSYAVDRICAEYERIFLKCSTEG